MNAGNFFRPQIIKQVAVTLIIAAMVGIGVYAFAGRNDQPSSSGSNNATSSVPLVKVNPSGITYPAPWQESKEIALENQQAGVISEANRKNPDTKIVIREVDAQLPKNFDIKKLPDEVATGLKNSLEGFSLKSKGVTKIDAYEAIKIEYSIMNTDQVNYINTMYIIPTAKKTFYVTYRGTEDLSKINDDINKINQSIAQYIKTHP